MPKMKTPVPMAKRRARTGVMMTDEIALIMLNTPLGGGDELELQPCNPTTVGKTPFTIGS